MSWNSPTSTLSPFTMLSQLADLKAKTELLQLNKLVILANMPKESTNPDRVRELQDLLKELG
jgi:hypothetical protein